ncbi:nucleoside recognition domain-containing protein [Bacillus badius]|uniref:Spore maturation protein A n=1 Tax=Bacillus badius TaxID=1455 RepID=A0ABR5AZZ5_BACBA|nr:nucleoside recognition domain-containing protein [Bacillus badius]KIL75181.1 Spore maturation protein A [Bacillus badius]KIL79833.1 Spore maturation protein A [Bacillus badius]KZN98930.1 spore maturation protein [Bacillus badius]KZR60279.1 spore maturation protein [Bacillus badius]MED0664860.1 nucleoside recognition domain-containing protein [Bacillus badius]
MVNFIWVGLTIIGLIFAAVNGKMDEVNEAVFKSAGEAVTICIGLVSVLVFWLGLMRIAEEAGLLKQLARLFEPFARRLFPDVPSGHPAMGYILSNMTANFFGLGNAATPLGIKAMEELKRLNGGKAEASRSMITFLAINTSSITLIPTTVLAIRFSYHSASPAEIIAPTICATACSTVAAIAIDRFFYRRRKKREEK